MDFTVDAFRVKERKLDSVTDGIISKVYHSYEELPDDYDVIFITNPTIFHYEAINRLAGKTKHMFIEKPVFDRPRDIKSMNLSMDGVYYVACPLRHKKVMAYIKNLIDQGERFYSIRAISSSYLPDWREGTDYRMTYSARKELGGGVELDLIHEWDYIAYLFGLPEKMFKFTGRISHLEIDTEDIAIYIGKYPDKTVELHLDYFGAETARKLELLGERKKCTVDFIRNEIQIFTAGQKEQRIAFGEDDCYLSEMEYFLDLVERREKSFNEVDRAQALIKFILEDQD